MEITERVSKLGEDLHNRRIEGKLEAAQQQNDRLKNETKILRDGLSEDRSEVSRLLAALEASNASSSGSRHRLRRLMSLSVVAGTAYVLGAKAGRERYEQLRSRWDGWFQKGRSTASDLRGRAGDVVEDAKVATERVSDATALISETAQSIVDGPKDAKPTRA